MKQFYLADKSLSLRDKGLLSLLLGAYEIDKKLIKDDSSFEQVKESSLDNKNNVENAISQLRKYGYFARFKDGKGETIVYISNFREVEEIE